MARRFSSEEPELMDLPQPVTPLLEKNLANLASLNRWFGSQHLVSGFLRRWLTPGRSLRVLDLATGSGDIPRLIARRAAARGCEVQIHGVDANSATIEIARGLSVDYSNITWVCADALSYDPGHAFDLVCCSLALHHFSDEDAVALLAHIRQLTRRYALVVDLERSRFTTTCIWLVTGLFYREEMTRSDGLLSARRAFSSAEMPELARRAGWPAFGHRRYVPCRQALWLELPR